MSDYIDPDAPMCACGHLRSGHGAEGCFACAGPPCDTPSGIVAALNALDGSDPEVAHVQADRILLAAMPIEVQEAYLNVIARCSWWAHA